MEAGLDAQVMEGKTLPRTIVRRTAQWVDCNISSKESYNNTISLYDIDRKGMCRKLSIEENFESWAILARVKFELKKLPTTSDLADTPFDTTLLFSPSYSTQGSYSCIRVLLSSEISLL